MPARNHAKLTRPNWLRDERAFECRKLGMATYSTKSRSTKTVMP